MTPRRSRLVSTAAAVALTTMLGACKTEQTQAVSLEAAKQLAADFAGQGITVPPRTISDIIALVEEQKPDAARIDAIGAKADAQPAPTLAGRDLYRFLVDRGTAAGELGRTSQQVTDLREAVRLAEANGFDVSAAYQRLQMAEAVAGNTRSALELARKQLQAMEREGKRAGTIAANSLVATYQVWLGDIAGAQASISAADGVLNGPLFSSNPGIAVLRPHHEGAVLRAKIELAAATGRYAEAEEHARRSLTAAQQILATEAAARRVAPDLPPVVQFELVGRVRLGNVLRQQGRTVQAETEFRRALSEALRLYGRYAPWTGSVLSHFAASLLEEARYEEALKLSELSLDIWKRLGRTTSSRFVATTHAIRAAALGGMRNSAGALAAWNEARSVFADDPEERFHWVEGRPDYISAGILGGRPAEVLGFAERLSTIRTRRFGENALETAEARGLFATALARSGQSERALSEFRIAVPRLMQRSSDSEEESGARDRRIQLILETYIDLLTRSAPTQASAAEAFRVSQAARARSVERALASSAARTSIRDPELARLARQEQDAQKQITAQFALLSKILSSPPEEQDAAATTSLREQVERLRAARATLRAEIDRRFPDYGGLIDAKPVSLEDAQKTLRPGEALLSVYVGTERSFVWGVPARGAPAFARVELGEEKLAGMVAELRKALAPKAATIGDIPRFDVSLSHRLYRAVVQPVAAGFGGAESLIVVPDRALGELPFSLLATEDAGVGDDTGAPLFTGYRKVPFLVRTVAVTQLPSVAALGTLRRTQVADANRKPFVGFGDPWFSQSQARRAQQQVEAPQPGVATRGLPLALRASPSTGSAASADLAMLPRLPDTAEELRSVAAALKSDPARDIFLGAAANEQQLRSLDLSDRRVVMFATHGLIPGELNGLTQPALALSAPQVAGVDGDGLLTMDEILALRLNADWVVLSACNTGSASGAGAEAVSGLGRAFFYAGTRALLVTNWPVETTSARRFTTDVFRRQVQAPELGRAAAVRQSMLALIDGDGVVVDGKTLFTYAHPIFWAPFSIVGDGG